MPYVIETKGLTKIYGSLYALKDLDLTLEEGNILGYLGPNGSGKTTTIKLLLGLIYPTSGTINIFGKESSKNFKEIHKDLAYVASEPAFWPNLTAKETLYFFSKFKDNYDLDYQNKLIKRFDLDINKKIRQYSRGNRQKIAIISALARRSKLIIMDEPSTGLDPIMEQVFKESIFEAKENGQTIFLSSHILEEVEAICDQIAILKNGKLIEFGSLEKLKHLNQTKFEVYFNNQKPVLSKNKNIINLKIEKEKMTFQVVGSTNEILAEVLKYKPNRIYSLPTSLEDLFLSVYKNTK